MPRRGLRLALAGLLVLLAWEASGLDLVVSAAFGGPAGFAWRNHWLTRDLLHEGGRLLGWTLFALVLVDAAHPLVPGPRRDERWLGVLLVLASLVLVPALKRSSASSCPWDLQPFGGAAPWVPHWLPGAVDGGPGHCFPSGHAVAAFAFVGLWFAWRRSRPRLARAVLAAVLVAGALFGAAQVARGAHFVSHVLWSAWLCAVIAAAGAAIAERLQRRRAAVRPAV